MARSSSLDQRKLEDLPQLYTRYYSSRQFGLWRQLFTDSAIVIRLDKYGNPMTMPIDQAVELYRRHAASCSFLSEVWREVEIRADGNVAHIRASYCLITDKEQRQGKDLLTLVRQQGVWKIACLAYEQLSLELRKGGRVSSTLADMPARPGVQVAGNLADGLSEQARLRPRDPAVHLPGGIVDFEGLERLVWRCVTYLAERQVRAGDLLVLSFAGEFAALICMLACARMGGTIFWVPVNTPPLMRASMIAGLEPKVLLTDMAVAEDGVPWSKVHIDPGELLRSGAAVDERLRDPSPSSPWLIISGSGSTGKSKKIPISHCQFLAQRNIYNQALDIGPGERIGSLLSIDTVVTRERYLDALLSGASVVLGGAGQADAVAWLEAHKVSVLWATVMHAESLLLADRDAERHSLQALRAFIVGSSTVSEALRKRICEKITDRLYVYYGMNETGLVSLAAPQALFSGPQTVGTVVAGCHVEIVDAQDAVVPVGEIGLVRVAHPGMTSAYIDDAKANIAAFRNGWFYPGDLGRFNADGCLDFFGRADHMMIMNGINIYPAEIEQLVTTHPDVRDAAATPLKHAVHQDVPVCSVALFPGRQVTERELLEYVRERLGARSPRRIFVFDHIPRTPAGKLIRAELARLIGDRLESDQARCQPS